MLSQQRLAFAHVQALGLRVEEGGHRCLGVDHQHLVARQTDQHVGANPSPEGADGVHLFVEVAPREHARRLQHPSKLDLAPGAADRGGAQRPRERCGLLPEVLGLTLHPSEQRTQRAELLHPVALERADLRLHPAERVAQRREQGGGLQVLGERGLEVDDPVSQQVTLGEHGSRACGIHQTCHGHRCPDTEDHPDDTPDPCAHGAEPATGHRQRGGGG